MQTLSKKLKWNFATKFQRGDIVEVKSVNSEENSHLRNWPAGNFTVEIVKTETHFSLLSDDSIVSNTQLHTYLLPSEVVFDFDSHSKLKLALLAKSHLSAAEIKEILAMKYSEVEKKYRGAKVAAKFGI